VLGFGAGIVPTALAQSHPEAVVESVDISADVLAAASCFGVETGEKMKLKEADGRAYLEGLEDGALDMLIMDIYDDKAHIPPCFTTAEFFAVAKRKLSKDGTFAMNVVTDQLQDVLPSVVASFSNVQLGTLANNRGNNVLLATVSSSANPDGTNEGTAQNSFAQFFDDGFASVLASWSREVAFSAVSQTGMKPPRADSDWCA
jgi:spermidine synthase